MRLRKRGIEIRFSTFLHPFTREEKKIVYCSEQETFVIVRLIIETRIKTEKHGTQTKYFSSLLQ